MNEIHIKQPHEIQATEQVIHTGFGSFWGKQFFKGTLDQQAAGHKRYIWAKLQHDGELKRNIFELAEMLKEHDLTFAPDTFHAQNLRAAVIWAAGQV